MIDHLIENYVPIMTTLTCISAGMIIGVIGLLIFSIVKRK